MKLSTKRVCHSRVRSWLCPYAGRSPEPLGEYSDRIVFSEPSMVVDRLEVGDKAPRYVMLDAASRSPGVAWSQ